MKEDVEEVIEWQEWFDQLGDPLFVVDYDHKILKSNKAAAEFLGKSKEEIEGSRCFQVVHDSAEPPEKCPLDVCIEEHREVEEEFYEPHLDRHVRAKIFPGKSPEGERDPGYCTHQLQDITEEKRRIEELESFPKRNPHPIMEWNSEMELTFANEAAKRLLRDRPTSDGGEGTGCLEDELPRIRDEIKSKFTGNVQSDGETESPQLYREFTCTVGDQERVYGFYFHYAPTKESIRAYGFEVTKRHQSEKELRRTNEDLELLIQVNHLLTRVDEQSELLDRACRAITGVRDYPLVWVGRKDEGPEKRVIPVACSGFEREYMDDLDVRWSENELGQGPTGRAIRRNEAQVQEKISIEKDENYRPWRDRAEEHEFSASIALPIPRGEDGDVFGALNIYLQNRSTVSSSRVKLLQELANDLGYGLQHIKTQNELREMTIGTLEALSRTVEAKDKYTGDHIDRVKDYALEIGRSLGLAPDKLEQLGYASELHDVGKVQIPDSILGKPEKLTEEEWEVMEKHPAIGAEIVGKVPRLERAAKIVAQHQEKYDGSGYPEGLEGEQITLEARIIAVVDAWDAMQTDRPYRDAIPREEAIKELTENAGSQFDPDIVDEFLRVLGDGGSGID